MQLNCKELCQLIRSAWSSRCDLLLICKRSTDATWNSQKKRSPIQYVFPSSIARMICLQRCGPSSLDYRCHYSCLNRALVALQLFSTRYIFYVSNLLIKMSGQFNPFGSNMMLAQLMQDMQVRLSLYGGRTVDSWWIGALWRSAVDSKFTIIH